MQNNNLVVAPNNLIYMENQVDVDEDNGFDDIQLPVEENIGDFLQPFIEEGIPSFNPFGIFVNISSSHSNA